jgi:hypothetical protein
LYTAAVGEGRADLQYKFTCRSIADFQKPHVVFKNKVFYSGILAALKEASLNF